MTANSNSDEFGIQSRVEDTRPGAITAGRCTDCGRATFPRPAFCPWCHSTDIGETILDGEGVVYAATAVRHGPKGLTMPYGLAYVDLDLGIRVMSGYDVDETVLEPGTRVIVSQVGVTQEGIPRLIAGAST